MMNHANEVGRDRGSEAIGWLLGYFSPGAVTVLDSVGATRYRSQSRYGAEADPREELALASSYPRAVGIVGLYHSHPFRDETKHAIFHSETDDITLKSRASRRADYLSVVTDGHDAEVFVLDREKTEVRPEVVDGLSYRDVLRRYACDVSLELEADLALAGMEGLVAALEREVSQEVGRALREKDAELDTATGVLKVPGLVGKATKNAIRVVPGSGKAHVELQVRSEIAVYLAAEEADMVLAVLRDEVLDSVVFLLWHGLDPRALVGPVVATEANLGSLRVHETNPLPKKMYKPSGRALVVRKGAP
jgi:hypothetical protein